MVETNECEICSLNSFVENKGIGTALINKVKEYAEKNSCSRIKLTTTNDNIRGLEFYQKRGFTFSNLFKNSVEEYSRKLKPQIPLYADNELPIKDEIELELLAQDISSKESGNGVLYLYESTSHLALAYLALYDLIRNSTKNISVCQNCGRYYLQSSGKEVYYDLFNLDGSPSCKTYASRKAYDNKIEDDIAELTYKREYQRRITQVYRADKKQKEQMKKDFKIWKDKPRKHLKLYRENKLSKEKFCTWIEKNK